MSRRLVWTATLALVALAGLCSAASAQYGGYGYPGPAYGNGYPDRQYFEGDPDPGYGGLGYGGPASRPYDDRYREPQGYNDEQGPRGEPTYVEPPYGGRYGSQPPSDEDLGASADQHTMVEVANDTKQPPGTIVIDTASRYLYLTQPDGKALRYGIGVGRQGFAWKGTAKVERKSEWPDWIPPSDMLKRRPDLPLRMSGGLDNPLGARAMYLYQGNKDTLFRIHGTNEPDTIGKAVSSGCIRMMNGDVIDLYNRVPIGTRVVVL